MTAPGTTRCGIKHDEPRQQCASCRLSRRMEPRARVPKALRPCGCGRRGPHRYGCGERSKVDALQAQLAERPPVGVEFAAPRELRRYA